MTGASDPLLVSRAGFPPPEEFLPYLERLFETRSLSNAGELHQRLEASLAGYLGVSHLTLVANATLGLMLALRQATGWQAGGEVVTTPFSFVATAHAITWAGLTPVFADIDPDTLNLDPARAAAALGPATVALLPVHCFGRPCDTFALADLAAPRGLPVVYDAAHAFGVRREGRSLLAEGTLSVLSLHATKVFHTCEGGAIVSGDPEAKARLDRLRNFGLGPTQPAEEVGLNAKLSELHALVGLLLLPGVDEAIAARARVHARYVERLRDARGLRLLPLPSGVRSNHGYFPVLVEPEFGCDRDALLARLRERGIGARAYFSPLLSDLPAYRALPSASPTNLPVATRVARQVLCLPMHPELTEADQDRVVEALRA